MMHKSFYDVRFGVPPGAARKDAHHICGSLDQVRSALENEFDASVNVWLMFDCGADVALDVYQRGERVRTIDFHPFVTIRVNGYPHITFTGRGKPTGYGVGADDPDKVRTELGDAMFAGELDGEIEVVVDWDGIVVPPLLGEIADYGDYVMLGDEPLDDDLDDLDEDELEDELIERGYVEYGSHDFEA